jgi:cyclic pyranopterin phosphate synthase
VTGVLRLGGAGGGALGRQITSNSGRAALRSPVVCGKLLAVQLLQIRARRPVSPASQEPVLVDRVARRVRYLRVSLTDRCNYRCTYCMPPEGIEHVPRADLLALEEVAKLAETFAAWGVERVRLTGGEPSIRKGFTWLVERLSGIRRPDGQPLEVVMTTNGERLPEIAEDLARAGLSGLTVSLDSLDPERFQRITRRGRLDRVLAGFDAARRAGFRNIKLNTVAVRGFNDDELSRIAEFAWERDMHPRFIELMPMSAGELFMPGTLIPAAAIRDRIASDLGLRLEPDDGGGVRGLGPATYWRVASGPHAGRRLGTIAAMTENFCADCNRLRISATGRVHGCLARDESADLRLALRSGDDAALGGIISDVLASKKDAHDFSVDGTGGPRKAMISIGG